MKTRRFFVVLTFFCAITINVKAQEKPVQNLKVFFEKETSKNSLNESHQALIKFNELKNPFAKKPASAGLKTQLSKFAVINGKGAKQTLKPKATHTMVLVSENSKSLSRFQDGDDIILRGNKPKNEFADSGDTSSDYFKPTKIAIDGEPLPFKLTKLSDSSDTQSDYLTFTEKVGVLFIPERLKNLNLDKIQAQRIEKGSDYEVWQWVDAQQKSQPELILIFSIE